MAFWTLEPFGTEAPYLGSAQIAAILANAHRKASRPAFSPKDFIPQDHDPESDVLAELERDRAFARRWNEEPPDHG